ncbi:MAG: FMN-binding protein [Deltaproteobacteria bacterium]|nr:FMN-binding protein [Deltaproteobacteria bacterium]
MRSSQRLISLLVLIFAASVGPAVAPGAASDEEVYLTPEEAPGLLFPEATSINLERARLTPALREEIGKRIAPTRPSLWEPSVPVYLAKKEGSVVGYAVVVNEIGKHRPITFVVGVETDGRVRGVEIMVYRESVGSDVRAGRFLKQYRGKTLEAPLRAGRDITNISGATLSVRAVNRGTRKALALIEILYGTAATAGHASPPRSRAGQLGPVVVALSPEGSHHGRHAGAVRGASLIAAIERRASIETERSMEENRPTSAFSPGGRP